MKSVIPIGINLLWLRPGKVGGTEFFTRNLLDGFLESNRDFHLALICSNDNAESFKSYTQDKRFEMIICPFNNESIINRISWQNLHLNKFLKKNNIKYVYSPVYDRPFFNGGLTWWTTILDLQAYHYPEYHPFHELVYQKLLWRIDKLKSHWNFAISEYVKKDSIDVYGFHEDKMSISYVPVQVTIPEASFINSTLAKYDLTEKKFFYTISQIIKHKNFITLVKTMKLIKDNHSELPQVLVVSGIRGNAAEELEKMIEQEGLQDNIIFTGFVSNEEKFALYSSCFEFLFPSVFEGFGMTPIEAMLCGATTITTKCTSIPEVTQGKANYVDEAMDPEEWIKAISTAHNDNSKLDASIYDKKLIADDMLNFFFSKI
ncbi:MAG: glycosyltransferase family 4 protein [Saccharofermentans sp.]|nr:glycosyltransferase family 4 protein [Saccharofermentans sp.]